MKPRLTGLGLSFKICDMCNRNEMLDCWNDEDLTGLRGPPVCVTGLNFTIPEDRAIHTRGEIEDHQLTAKSSFVTSYVVFPMRMADDT